MLNRHPTFKRAKPGMHAANEPAADPLAQSAELLDLIDAGTIPASEPPPFKVKNPNLLTAEEERELSRRFQTYGDIASRNTLIQANRGLIGIHLRRYRGRADYQDMEHDAILGVIRAAEIFDPDLGYKFSTLASLWIKAKISDRHSREARCNSTPTDDPAMHNRRAHLRTRLALVPLDRPVGEGDGGTVGDTVAANQPNPEEQLALMQRAAAVRQAAMSIVADGSPRVRDIISMRLLADDPVTLEVIAQKYGTSRECIRQNEKKILEKIQERLVV